MAQPSSTRPTITAFFPCYNDSATIASMVITADRTLRELADDYEIIVANDASLDNSAAILDELCQIYPHLRVIHHSVNRGYGGNLRSIPEDPIDALRFHGARPVLNGCPQHSAKKDARAPHRDRKHFSGARPTAGEELA